MAYTTINKSTDYFNTKLYTGNATARTISEIGFQPDWVWGKSKTNTENYSLFDAVRGAGYDIKSDVTNAQASNTGITAFNSDGYVLGTADSLNSNGQSFVTWNWKANGQGSSNTDGSVNTTYTSVNTTAGFSISKYTNPASGSPFTIGHGLGSPPKMVIIKNLSAAQTWGVWNTGIAFGKYLRLDSTATEASANLVTATSNTTFSTYQDHHSTGNELIAYCFAPIKGFSAMGSYTGTANADGAFVYTGFKPAWVLIKNTAATEAWFLYDNKRGLNGSMKALFPDENAAEGGAADNIDLLSNGFKLRTAGAILNSNANFIYLAFAEAPLVGSNNVPANAR